jgi:hypothetical protein
MNNDPIDKIVKNIQSSLVQIVFDISAVLLHFSLDIPQEEADKPSHYLAFSIALSRNSSGLVCALA